MDWDCPACGFPSQRCFKVRHGYWIRGCAHCDHRFAECEPSDDHVTRVYNDEYFFGGGAGYPDYLSEGVLLRRRGAQYARLLATHTTPGMALDVGAAAGFVADEFRRAGWAIEGLEPNPRMAQYGARLLNLTIHSGTLETFRTDRRYRLVMMLQIAQHFFNLRRAFETAADLTEPGGFWLIEVGNNRSWTAHAFGKYWHEYNPPSVLNYFSRRSLSALAGQLGFAPVASGRPRKWISWRHARSLVEHQTGSRWIGRAMRMLPDRLVLPYISEDMIWMLFRKQPVSKPYPSGSGTRERSGVLQR